MHCGACVQAPTETPAQSSQARIDRQEL
jgi:hypothetical protein